jgi:hypothetical protein
MIFFAYYTALLKVRISIVMQWRNLCVACGKNPVAINYKRGDKTYFRTRCDRCIRRKKNVPAPRPKWLASGYRKKPVCEHCGFKAKFKEQLFVYHVDGNLNNTALSNLKTVCANCQIEIAKSGLGWAQGDLVPDF